MFLWQQRYALCVGLNDEWCKILYADDLSSIGYRPIFEGAIIGRWYCLSNNGGLTTKFEPLLEDALKPIRTLMSTVNGKNYFKMLITICLAPNFSEFGWNFMKSFKNNRFYSPLIEQGGTINCILKPNQIEPGIIHRALLNLHFENVTTGLPCWSLDSFLDNNDENAIFTPFSNREDGIVLKVIPNEKSVSVAILCLVDGQLAFSRILEKEYVKAGDAITFSRINLDCFSNPFRMAVDIIKTTNINNVRFAPLEALSAQDKFLLRLPLDNCDFTNQLDTVHISGFGNLHNLYKVLATESIERIKSTTVLVHSSLCILPEQSIPLWIVTKFIGSENGDGFNFNNTDKETTPFQYRTDLISKIQDQKGDPTRKKCTSTSRTNSLDDDDDPIEQMMEAVEDDSIELEQETVVLFTQIIGLELHMRFFDEREAKFTSYRCCNRNDLPSCCVFNPPVPGTWARITFKLSQNNVRNIQIKSLQTDSNFGAIIRNAKEIVRPENEQIWTTFINCNRACTVQQLVEEVKEAQNEDGSDGRWNDKITNETEESEDPIKEGDAEYLIGSELCPASLSTANVPRHPATLSSLPSLATSCLLSQTSKKFDSAIENCGIVVDFLSIPFSSSSNLSIYHVWPFCTNRSNPRILILGTSEMLPLGHWLKFDLKDYKSGVINAEKCSRMIPYLKTKIESLNGKQIPYLETCITIPADYGEDPRAEIWTFSWKPGHRNVPFICKLMPKSKEVENDMKSKRGDRCIARLMFESIRDHDGVTRGCWYIDKSLKWRAGYNAKK